MNKADDFSIHISSDFPINRKYLSAFVLLCIFLLLVYSNSYNCSWHFDDYGNIVQNETIQITNLSWQNIEKSFYGIIGSDRWQRPVAYFSFLLNYYFGGLNVAGYHVVNISIHCLTAFFLFLFIYQSLQLPLIKAKYEKNAYSIALLAALLWAGSPLHVTSVTYIVQRMASMAALFYIMAMFFYLEARIEEIVWRRIMLFALSFLSGLLAIGTKENAAMLPVSLFLFDLFLIRGVTKENIKRSWKYGILAALSVLAIGLMFIGDISSISSDFEIRPFTMAERVLTQPRVLMFYLSLLFYPLTARMMLIHDIDLSTSLFHPWTTLPAILIIVIILAAALWKSKQWPLISYCVVFFFLNHFIEGSFLSLELIYEHRNYLPSLLIFLPISLLIIHGLRYYSTNRAVSLTIASAVTALLIVLGVTVYIQNNIYKDDVSLWSDNKEKAPRLHAVRNNLATAYFVAGMLPEAFEEAQVAMKSYQAAMPSRKSRTYGLLGEYHFQNGRFDEALPYYKKALEFDGSHQTMYRRIAQIMIKEARFRNAELYIKKALTLNPGSFPDHNVLSTILLKQGFYDKAIITAFNSLRLKSDQWEPYSVISDALKAKGRYRDGDHFRAVAESFRRTGRGN